MVGGDHQAATAHFRRHPVSDLPFTLATVSQVEDADHRIGVLFKAECPDWLPRLPVAACKVGDELFRTLKRVSATQPGQPPREQGV